MGSWMLLTCPLGPAGEMITHFLHVSAQVGRQPYTEVYLPLTSALSAVAFDPSAGCYPWPEMLVASLGGTADFG